MHDKYGWIWNVFTCGEISNFSTYVWCGECLHICMLWSDSHSFVAKSVRRDLCTFALKKKPNQLLSTWRKMTNMRYGQNLVWFPSVRFLFLLLLHTAIFVWFRIQCIRVFPCLPVSVDLFCLGRGHCCYTFQVSSYHSCDTPVVRSIE